MFCFARPKSSFASRLRPLLARPDFSSPSPPLGCVKRMLPLHSDHVCLALMDEVVDASSGKISGVPRVSIYDARKFEIGRQFPPGHLTVEASDDFFSPVVDVYLVRVRASVVWVWVSRWQY